MRPARRISDEARLALPELLKKTRTKGDFQRLQCVWLRVALNLSAPQVATAMGWSPGTVRSLWSRYLAGGEAALLGKSRGGRRRQNLRVEQEERLLAPFFAQAQTTGGFLVSDVKAAYEQAVGHQVPKSTVYRMLARHGWRRRSPAHKSPPKTNP